MTDIQPLPQRTRSVRPARGTTRRQDGGAESKEVYERYAKTNKAERPERRNAPLMP